MRRVGYHPRVLEDVDEIAIYLEQDSEEAADRFHATVEKAFRHLAELPGMGAPRYFLNPRLGELRFWPIKGFERYLEFYRTTRKSIEFLRVLHASRDIQNILEEDFGPG